MHNATWVSQKSWVGPEWSKFVLRKQRASLETWTEIRDWLWSQPGGTFMAHVVEYDQYIVVKIQNPNDAFAFKMRWL